MNRARPALLPLWLAFSCVACSAAVGASADDPGVEPQRTAIIYDGDAREELFELADPALRARVESSLVAFIPREWLIEDAAGVALAAPSQAQAAGVCADERFAAQPAAARCSGVLVDWDLVLTAAHCVLAGPLDANVVVFGYHYRAPGQLALDPAGVFEVAEVVTSALELEGGRSTLDYAFVRLHRATSFPNAPVPLRRAANAAPPLTPVLAAGANGGLPIKVDRGGVVQAARGERHDHFVASTDTAGGGSGGAAFDRNLALLGVLFRGGDDLAPAGDCLRENRVSAAEATETFAYAGRALADLCRTKPHVSSLCRANCGDPCIALPRPTAVPAACSAGRPSSRGRSPLALASLACALALRRRFAPRARRRG